VTIVQKNVCTDGQKMKRNS